VAGCFALTLAACGDDAGAGGTDTAGEADTVVADTTPTDTYQEPLDIVPVDTAPPADTADAEIVEGGFASPCSSNEDCDSGWCVEGPEGYICTKLCDSACPEGFACKSVTSSVDPAFICLPELRRPCSPCQTDAQCPQGGRCLELDGSRGCAPPCADDEDCGLDFTCLASPVEADGGATFCQPDTGSCACRPGVDGGQRLCVNENAVGSCSGVATCDPVSGWGDCDAPTPSGEVCDFTDNDCDGANDEDFRDASGDWTLDAHCGTCGNGCADKFDNGTGVCSDAGSAPVCVVESCGEGYVRLNDFQCVEPPDVSCQPCASSATCWDGECLAVDGQDVCVMPCDGVDDCADGFSCVSWEGAQRCLPDTGSCSCNAVTAGQARPCAVTNDVGVCTGIDTCDATAGWSGCQAPTPVAEVCNGVDDDCDGDTDTELTPELCKLTKGVCEGATKRCAGALGWLPCGATDYGAGYELTEVTCDGDDNDCDGVVDEVDNDGDGVVASACGGLDCDDANPLAYPGAAEIYDTRDSDCDGLVDEGQIPAGAVIVSEIMVAPTGGGRWLELYNAWSYPVNVASWTLSDGAGHAAQLDPATAVVLQPGEAAVVCADTDPTTNGGVACDYGWGDELALDGVVTVALDGQVIDVVSYAGFTGESGRSLSLDPNTLGAAANDIAGNWCPVPLSGTALAGGDHGTPGDLNPACSGAPIVASVTPDNGVDNGGESVLVHGSGFTGATAVRFGGVGCATWQVNDDATIACVTPAGNAGRVTVTVDKGSQSGSKDEAYRYTGEAVAHISWCDIQFPSTLPDAIPGVPVGDVYGQVRSIGVTEAAGAPDGIVGEIGWGPLGSDPRNAPGWTWSDDTSWYAQYFDNDEFLGTFTIPEAGVYSYGWRFTDDAGLNYIYCDFDPGTADTFSVSDLGTVTVD